MQFSLNPSYYPSSNTFSYESLEWDHHPVEPLRYAPSIADYNPVGSAPYALSISDHHPVEPLRYAPSILDYNPTGFLPNGMKVEAMRGGPQTASDTKVGLFDSIKTILKHLGTAIALGGIVHPIIEATLSHSLGLDADQAHAIGATSVTLIAGALGGFSCSTPDSHRSAFFNAVRKILTIGILSTVPFIVHNLTLLAPCASLPNAMYGTFLIAALGSAAITRWLHAKEKSEEHSIHQANAYAPLMTDEMVAQWQDGHLKTH